MLTCGSYPVRASGFGGISTLACLDTIVWAAAGEDPTYPAGANYIEAGMAEKKNALITGITGQDGSYLAELLL